jgi:hypothetical protein
MRLAYTSLIIVACGAVSLHALAAPAAGGATSTEMTLAQAAEQSSPVKTSDTGWAVPQSVALDPQIVQSQGGSLRPGPHNRRFTKPHGGPVASVARPDDVPGRQ